MPKQSITILDILGFILATIFTIACIIGAILFVLYFSGFIPAMLAI